MNTMNSQVEFYLQAEDSEDIIEPLSVFFAPIAPTIINKSKLVVKSTGPLQIILTIVTTLGITSWASKRFLLDPLGDKAENWWAGVSFLWKKSKFNRGIGITVDFQFPSDTFQVSIGDTSDPESIKSVWDNVHQACELYALARNKGLQIDQLRFIPDGTRDMLIIAYTENRPSYIADLETKTLKQIRSSENEDPSVEIWLVGQLIRRYDYMKMLAERGHEVSSEELQQLESEIALRKNSIRE